MTRVRLHLLRETRLLVDLDLGGAGRRLRLMGLDVRCEFAAEDAQLAEVSMIDHRILLTRDRDWTSTELRIPAVITRCPDRRIVSGKGPASVRAQGRSACSST
ncbi:hypothetical protein GV793_14915 [Nocardia cyriacigeorgica]|nr:hypothetical protein [Nocardia cyriacigeorgica]